MDIQILKTAQTCLIMQARINAVTCFCFLVFTIGCMPVVYKQLIKHNDEEMRVVGQVLLWCLVAFAFVVAYNMATCIINPEYWAIKNLIG